MANRPGTLCNLKPGKAIGAQANFAATFNWLVSAVRKLRGGKGVKVSWPSDDTPVISADGEDGNNGGDGGDTSAVNAVADVAEEPITEGKRLTVTYTDESAAKGIDIPYKPEFTGTNNSTTGRAVDFVFASDQYSNVTVKCVGGVITIGAYYV